MREGMLVRKEVNEGSHWHLIAMGVITNFGSLRCKECNRYSAPKQEIVIVIYEEINAQQVSMGVVTSFYDLACWQGIRETYKEHGCEFGDSTATIGL